ncbi:MAG: hypothetical protein CVV49_08935 [Spirochaetae bacterium HGW-Spirochaetae-5]|nr:MAG: hypothetical protein CVV49_08935 [Spirochaetae bacterium HGW-Spirochaetae-5]
MEHAEFMSAVKRYYGPYENKFVEEVVLKYILSLPESDLENLYTKLISTIPRRENQNPVDIARIKNLSVKTDDDYRAEALDWWSKLNRSGSSLDDVIISDIRVQACVEDMGGWGAFCQRDIDKEHFHQEKFIKWFVMYSRQTPDRESKVLIGESSRRKTPLMIGDKQHCRNLLQLSAVNSEQYLKLAESIPDFMHRV